MRSRNKANSPPGSSVVALQLPGKESSFNVYVRIVCPDGDAACRLTVRVKHDIRQHKNQNRYLPVPKQANR